ncbi:hypothetical protein BC936DRAFT_144594 [Jimgerdemannia flammicorona]|uniref:Uncharacterized protein n=1 Tax=Jimgerdemannia flammicorona TaxID=994334 RepID=A0A433DC66_9FUNG|nr:hypothetical protein BC936DRAFT_144594 [Jimgerdemannia flammicorona]
MTNRNWFETPVIIDVDTVFSLIGQVSEVDNLASEYVVGPEEEWLLQLMDLEIHQMPRRPPLSTDLALITVADLGVEPELISDDQAEYRLLDLLLYLWSDNFAEVERSIEPGSMDEFEAELRRRAGRTWTDAMIDPLHAGIVGGDAIFAVVGGSLCIVAVVRREWRFGIALLLLFMWRQIFAR